MKEAKRKFLVWVFLPLFLLFCVVVSLIMFLVVNLVLEKGVAYTLTAFVLGVFTTLVLTRWMPLLIKMYNAASSD